MMRAWQAGVLRLARPPQYATAPDSSATMLIWHPLATWSITSCFSWHTLARSLLTTEARSAFSSFSSLTLSSRLEMRSSFLLRQRAAASRFRALFLSSLADSCTSMLMGESGEAPVESAEEDEELTEEPASSLSWSTSLLTLTRATGCGTPLSLLLTVLRASSKPLAYSSCSSVTVLGKGVGVETLWPAFKNLASSGEVIFSICTSGVVSTGGAATEAAREETRARLPLAPPPTLPFRSRVMFLAAFMALPLWYMSHMVKKSLPSFLPSLIVAGNVFRS